MAFVGNGAYRLATDKLVDHSVHKIAPVMPVTNAAPARVVPQVEQKKSPSAAVKPKAVPKKASSVKSEDR